MAFDTEHDAICFYCFWSLFYGLGPMIWFYPLNELDITGYEAYAAIWLIPVISAVPMIRRAVSSQIGLRLLECGMLAGICSFQMGTTLSRLQVLALGNGSAVLYLCGRFFYGDVDARRRSFWSFLGANLLFLASRLPLASIAPAWASHPLNWAVFSIFAASVISKVFFAVFYRFRVVEKQATPHSQVASTASVGLGKELLYGASLGSLFYLTHWVFGELGVLSRWCVTGKTTPPSLITPYFTSPLVLLALSAGPLLATSFPRFTSSIPFWALGSASFLATYFLDDYLGFGCGLVLAVFTTALWVEVFRRIEGCRPGGLMGVAMVVYMLMIFGHVWTVAYNFVPGGVVTRERGDAMVVFMCLTFLPVFRRGSLDKLSGVKWPPKSFSVIVITALLIGVGATWQRTSPKQTKVLNPKTRDFSALIWTYHFGYDNQGWPSLQRTAKLLNDTGADVIALLESDASKPYLGMNDLALWLGERLGMYVDFGPATKDHTWGNLLLSKYPIIRSAHHLLPSPHGELAPAISATLNLSGALVTVISTHMGNDRDVLDRQLQTEFLSNISASSPHPVVFLGYVTSKPFSPNYIHFRDKGGLKDIDETDKARFCEYILYKGLVRQGYARISHGGLSDTELQLGRFSIPKGKNFVDNDVVVTDKDKVENWKRFSEEFGGFHEGHYHPWNHHYHMSTPKYFAKRQDRAP